MSRTIITLWALTAAASLAGPLVAWRAHAAAQRTATAITAGLASLQRQAEEATQLRAASPRTITGPRDDTALSPRLAQSLAAADLPPSTLASVTPHSETVTTPDSRKAVRRKAAVTLTPITLPQLGAFLESWRTTEPGWLVSSIEVSPDAASTAAPGADLPLRATLSLESLFATDPPGATP